MSIQLKHEALVLAGYLAPNEQMTAVDGNSSLMETVRRICAGPNASVTRIALIAVMLAAALDEVAP